MGNSQQNNGGSNKFLLWAIVIAIIYSLYSNNNEKKESGLNIKIGASNLEEINSNLQIINDRLNILDNDLNTSMRETSKYQLNLAVLDNTPCFDCHIDRKLLLPMRNISKQEFLEVLRQGNSVTRSKGMPKFKTTGNPDDPLVFTTSKATWIYEMLYLREPIRKCNKKEN